MVNNTEFKKAEIEMLIDGLYKLAVHAIMRSDNYTAKLKDCEPGSCEEKLLNGWIEREEAEIKKHYALIEKMRGAWFEAKE